MCNPFDLTISNRHINEVGASLSQTVTDCQTVSDSQSDCLTVCLSDCQTVTVSLTVNPWQKVLHGSSQGAAGWRICGSSKLLACPHPHPSHTHILT